MSCLILANFSTQGIHLDPSIYLMDEEKGVNNSRTEKKVPDSENPDISAERKTEHQPKNGLAVSKTSSVKENEHSFKSPECMPEEGRISEALLHADSHGTDFYDSAHSKEKGPKDEGKQENASDINSYFLYLINIFFPCSKFKTG
jgi:hypothetical protein